MDVEGRFCYHPRFQSRKVRRKEEKLLVHDLGTGGWYSLTLKPMCCIFMQYCLWLSTGEAVTSVRHGRVES